MRKSTRFAILLPVALLLGALAYAQQQPPAQIPLGDLVKQQKAAKKAKKVITNDDIPARPPEAAAPVPAAGAPGAPAAAVPADAQAAASLSATPPDQERQSKIAALKEEEEREKRIISKFEEALAEPNLSDNRRRMYEETVQKSRDALDRLTQQREALERQGSAPKPQPPGTPQ